MERERTRAGQPSAEETACAVCQGPVRGARCEACGAPVAPGGYRVLRQLAQGPHSRLFFAERGGVRVALKELLFALVPDTTQLEAFEREAGLLRQLSHPRIPRLHASFREGSGVHTRLYLAQDFVEGHSLQQELESHRFSEAEVRQVAREVLEVLAYLHGLSPQVLHRDVKPANLMRRPDGSLALVDFGAARDVLRGATHRATLVGTFGYMPPEQMGGTVDATSDLYALGATLIHLLSRRPPDELMGPGMELAFEDSINASEGMKALLRRLVERDRRQRFPSARAALEALDALERPRPAPPRPQVSSRATATPHAVWALAALVGLVFLAGLGTALLTRRAPAPLPAPIIGIPAVAPAPPASRVELPAPPLPQETPRPAPRAERVAPRPAVVSRSPKVEVAEVITLPGASRPRTFLLERDVRLAVGEEVALGDTSSCGPRPSALEVRRVELRAEGGGTLEAPRSRLRVDVVLRNHGANDARCHTAVVHLLDGSGKPLDREPFPNTRTGTEASRTLSFTIPRTLREVQLKVGTAQAPGATFVLDLVGGGFQRR